MRNTGMGSQRTGKTQPAERDSTIRYVSDNLSDVPPEAKSFLPGRRLPESKISRKIKVGNKTQHISQGIGYIDLNEFLQDKINAIVQPCSKKTYHYKSVGTRVSVSVYSFSLI